jgi:hypothetical protein
VTEPKRSQNAKRPLFHSILPRGYSISLNALILGGLTLNSTAYAQQWIANTPLPIGYFGQSLAYWNGYLYQTGGQGTARGLADGVNVYHVHVQGNGANGSWQSGPPLPAPVLYHGGVAANGFLYVLGGEQFTLPTTLVPTNVVYYAQINPDGSLGAWQTTTPLPLNLYQLTASVWNNTIYVIGGGTQTTNSSAVFSATINPNGTLSSWNTQPSLPAGLRASAAAVNGTLYILGGATSGLQNTVYYSPINPGGSLAGWNQTTPMPQALYLVGAVAFGGSVIFYGGYNGTAAVSNLYSAPVLGDGSLGSWSAGPYLPQPLYSFGTAVAGPYIFVTGGQSVSASQHTVYFYSATLPPPPTTPILTAQGLGANRSFQMQLTSSPNTGFSFQASTNLRTWVNIGSGFTDTNGLLEFQDTNAAGFSSSRLYRARWPLP